MEISTTAPASRTRTGSWLRKALSLAVLPVLAVGLLVGCGGKNKGMSPIIVDSFSPTSGPQGTIVTLQGSGFTNVSTVSVGQGAALEWTMVNDNQLILTVPASATTGPLTLVDPEWNAITPNSFSVTPILSTVSPTSGPVGTQVKITGSGLVGATLVTFGSATQASFDIEGPNQINAYVTSDATTGAVQVTVAGTVVTGPVFTVTPQP
jgi:hypothetical protein